jgi:hypothetical protein
VTLTETVRPMLNWFLELFNIEHLGYFTLGATAATGWHLVKARWQNRSLIVRWQYMFIPMVIIVAAHMAVQNQQNADCVREFNQVLRERAAVTTENDRLSIEQRKLIYDWIHNLIFPPPHIAELPGSHPVREKWAIGLTLETDKKFAESIQQQRENDARRAANPLPPPTCGL